MAHVLALPCPCLSLPYAAALSRPKVRGPPCAAICSFLPARPPPNGLRFRPRRPERVDPPGRGAGPRPGRCGRGGGPRRGGAGGGSLPRDHHRLRHSFPHPNFHPSLQTGDSRGSSFFVCKAGTNRWVYLERKVTVPVALGGIAWHFVVVLYVGFGRRVCEWLSLLQASGQRCMAELGGAGVWF